MRKDMHAGGLFTADNVEVDGNGIFKLVQFYPDNSTIFADEDGNISVRAAVYTNLTRPAANSFPIGYQIWNSDDKAPNFSGGPSDNNWYDASGNAT